MSASNHTANPLEPFLVDQGYVVIDGALATELERNGADLRDSLWSAKLLIEDPALISRVHAAYLHAGADVIATASYQATIEGFMSRGMSADAAAHLIRLSVDLAVEARDAFWSVRENRVNRLRPLVAASIGPYGAYLADGSEYSGDYPLSLEQLVDFHRPRLDILASTQADLFAFETIPSLVEARAIVSLLEEYPDVAAWIAFSCRGGHHVSHGERLAECAALAETSPAVVAVGVNCTAPEYIESLIAEAVAVTSKSIVVYPNSGEGWNSVTEKWIGRPEEHPTGAYATSWHKAGAQCIGGCCRTTPRNTIEVRAAMQALH